MRSGTPHIWRINMDGTDLKQLTSGDFADFLPHVSPDGNWVIFCSWRSGAQLLWRIPRDGGEAVRVTDVLTQLSAFSPDGKSIALTQLVQGATPPIQLAVIPFDGSAGPKIIPPLAHYILRGELGWDRDGRAIIVKSDQEGVGNLWRHPIEGGAPKPITNFTSDQISSFAVSKDGKRLAISRGNSSLDIVLIKDFR
jgi:Tol biopolymer transport system component